MRANTDQKQILIVEDEWIIGEQLKDMITQAGYGIAGFVGTVPKALALIEKGGVNAAILDVNLGKETSFAIAEALLARRVPFVFLTGYLTRDVPSEFADCKFLTKPVEEAELRRNLASLTELKCAVPSGFF